jgi:hypothetical protein
MISLPARDSSHIPGSLDPVASPAEDLEIIHGPLVTSHGDWPDVVQDVAITGVLIFRVAFMDLLPAPGTLPFLLKPDNSPHFGDCGPLPAPVPDTAGGLATEGIFVPGTEVCPLPATTGAGPAGEALLLLGSNGIATIFTHYHSLTSPSLPLFVTMDIFFPVQIMPGREG